MPGFADVERAHSRIGDDVLWTPTLHSTTLSAITGADLYLKFENHQFTSSFKERGALNRLLTLSDDEREKGVLAVSAGNHAQGVAYHSRRLGVACHIVMPASTPPVKLRNTRALGAEVVLAGDDFEAARGAADALVERHGYTFIHPFDDADVIAGQGTVMVEMIADAGELDVVVVPVGGGGLIAGSAIAGRTLCPRTEIVGVQSQQFSPVAARFGHDVPPSGSTVAEGIAVARPGALTTELIDQLVDDVVAVSEEYLERSIVTLLDIEKTVVEGAGAAGLAAVLAEPDRFAGRRVGLVLSGGNIDLRMIGEAIQRSLTSTGQVASLTVDLVDRPGQLAAVLSTIAGLDANVLTVRHDRNPAGLPLRHARVDVVVEVVDGRHLDALLTALGESGAVVRAASPDAGT